jgi:hypothetical protein
MQDTLPASHVSDEVAKDMLVFGIADEIDDVPREDDFEGECYGYWPDTHLTLNVFLELQTQWEMVGVEGELVRTGLRWAAVEILMDNTNGIPRKSRSAMFEQIRRMERAALNVFRAERKERLARLKQEADARRTS